MSSGTKKLHECPSNIKEALEWLEALEQGGGAQGPSSVAQVIKQQGKEIIKGFDGKEAQELCKAAKEFLGAIKQSSYASAYTPDGWKDICKDAASGGKCCGSGGSGCDQCQQSSGKCDGCCAKCPKQICARIFCLIVPVLSRVLSYMYAKCNYRNANQKGDWASQKLNESNGGTDLKDFMVACGFEADKLESKTGFQLAEKQQGSLTLFGGALQGVYNKLQECLKDQNASDTFLKDASKTSNAKPPNSICDLLLWLQFLPYSTNYQEVNKKLNGQIPKNSQDFDTLLKEFSSSIPMLFLFIEGKGKENGSKSNSIFQHIDKLSQCQYYYDEKYYNKPEDVVKMLVSAMPVLYWSIEQMKDKCTQSQCTSSVKDCEDIWKFLSLMGWKKDSSDFDHNIEGNMKCGLFKKYIETDLIVNSDKGRLNEIKKLIETEWKKENGSTGFTSSGQYLPRTIYEMLIWLMGLPVSEKFKDLKTQIQSLNNGVQLNDVMPEFTKILFEVPNLFLTLNGDLSGLLGNMYKFHGIGSSSGGGTTFNYGSSGSDCLKIFSAIVAILYPVIRYLQQRCMNGGQAFANGESWQNTQINADGLKTYLNFAGFDPVSTTFQQKGSEFHSDVLQPIFGDLTQENNDKLKKLYECAVKAIQKEAQNGGSTGSGSAPSTIRQMMLWLIGLPVTTQYGNGTGSNGLMQTVTQKANDIKDLNGKINNGQPTSFQHQLQHSIVGMMTVISQIEGGLESVVNFLKDGFKDTTGGKFKYDSDQAGLFTQFTSYVTSVHVQLRFLMVMCKTGKDQGGWQECTYANNNCNCNNTLKTSCLKDFLQNGNSGSGSGTNVFKLTNGKSEHLQMAFNQYANAPSSSQNLIGDHISTHLELMLDEIPTTQSGGTVEFKKPLSLLTQYCVAIGRIDPVSLGDHFDVFRELANGMWDKIEEKVKTEIKGITKDDESGQQASGKLQGALQAVWPDSHNGNPHPSDLASLTGCNGGTGNPCSPFIATLSHGLYKYFDPQPLRSPANKIDWLYMKMSGLYGKLAALKTEMESKCNCCPEGDPTSKCPGIIKCPVCLPQLYKMGLIFGDPVTIGPKNCRELHTKMTAVLDATSTLCLLFTKIEDGRFKPYLLFSAMVVKEKNGKGQLTVTGDENYNCYTHALGSEYKDTYLTKVKGEDKTKAQENKNQRTTALKCACSSHTYTPPTEVPGTATTVTLTLYFHKDGVTEIQLVVPHHGPSTNPLVRFYPRNLKSIVDWLLRIGQTRLGQDGSGVEEMIKTFWPRIETHLTEEDKNVFQQLVQKVMSLMGLENKGKNEVKSEIDAQYEAVKKKITDKLSGNGGDGFQQTFSSILQFTPNKYIDKVIDDFGKRVYDVNGSSDTKRSFNCIAKSVSTCMSTALKEIQKLATENKSEMEKYSVTIEDLKETIEEVSELNNISNLKTLCQGFKTFHGVYKTVEKAFSTHLQQAQQKGEPWTNITKCVEAFNELGECADMIGELDSMSGAEKMPEASKKLEKLYDKLQDVHEKLKGDGLSTFSEKVNTFIQELDDNHLKKSGESALTSALNINGSSTQFETFLKTYVSELIDQLKKNDQNNTPCDIHLRVRNDLQQLSECLKVMCEVCSTGMKEFAKELKTCVWETREKMKDIDKAKTKLEKLKTKLTSINNANSHSEMTDNMTKLIKYIRSLLRNPYIYQPQPIVKDIINSQATSKMTNYLKQLPNLIRDRYVLQKWKDDAKAFCGVQEFKEGIVKRSDIGGIEEELQELLRDTFHNDNTFGVTIHEFQVRALIYNFCHKEAMERIKVGLEAMESVKKALGNVNQNPPKPPAGLDWSQLKEESKKRELLPLLKKLSTNSYLRYFATHLRDSVGYHTLSNTLGALEKVKEKLEAKPPNGEPAEWKNIQDLLKKETMTDLHKKLDSLLDKLYKEYIFEYPPFDWTKSCHRVVAPTGASRARRSTDASAPSSASNTCEMCVPSMAHIFIGFVPQMYRLFKMLREMTTKDGREHTLEFKNYGRDASKTTMSSLAGILSREGWRMKDGSKVTGVPELGYDLNENKTGADVCTLLEKIIGDAEPGALVAQKDDASATDSSLKPLDKLFKAVMQHFKGERKKKIEKRIEEMEDEFNKKHKDSGLKFLAPPAPLPSTVRQVLFWLHEMDTNKEFYDAMSQHINNLCGQSRIDISHDTILHVLKLSATQCLEVLATIEDPGRQNADYYYELYTEEHYYAYPTVNIPLFFYTFVEKLMAAFLELNFVCVQCEFRALEGGWSECHIGKSEHSMKGQNCRCTKSHITVSSVMPRSVEGSVVCPRPLYSFLFGENTLKAPAEKKAYMSKGTMPCGFKLKNKAITDAATPGDATSSTSAPTSVSGSVLVEPLRKLVGGHVTGRHTNTSTRNDENNTLSTVIYLRDLLRYVLCLAVRPPWSMSENMAFFYRVTESWKQKGVGGVTVAQGNAELLAAIHKEIALFPGTFDGKLLTTAVERFAGIEDNNKHQNSAVSPTSSHHYDLRTLMGCQETNTPGTSASGSTIQCSPFMFPLALDVYTHYNEKNSRAYLSWILNFAFGIYAQLKALEEMIKEKECAMNASKGAPSTCPSLPMCPGVLSALYQSGSSFMDQRKLAKNTSTGSATTKKTCNDFHTVLTGLFNCDTSNCTPLHNLIVQCEAFLWSIRLPFSLVQLSLWSVAILFISYVFVVPLDHFKIKSHLFNRLKYTMHPSLLIADQQRRVSEVAYFSL